MQFSSKEGLMAPSPRVICSFLPVHFWAIVSPVVVVLQYYIYIYIAESYEKKRFILNSPMCIEEPDLKKNWRQLGIIHKQACVIKIIHFFLVRLIVHIRLWYASLDDRASERKRNLHKTHFKNMPPNFWCNKRATKIILCGTKTSRKNLGSTCRVLRE